MRYDHPLMPGNSVHYGGTIRMHDSTRIRDAGRLEPPPRGSQRAGRGRELLYDGRGEESDADGDGHRGARGGPAGRRLEEGLTRTMKYKPFGNTPLQVSEIGFGCARLGGFLQHESRGDITDLLRQVSGRRASRFMTRRTCTVRGKRAAARRGLRAQPRTGRDRQQRRLLACRRSARPRRRSSRS